MLHFPTFAMVMQVSCMLEVCDLFFFILILQGVTVERVSQVSEEILNFGIWNGIETVLDYGDFWSWIYCVFCIIWLQECGWFEYEWPLQAHLFQVLVIRFWHNFRRIKRCFLIGVNVDMLEKVCQWRWALWFQKPVSGWACLSVPLWKGI